MFDDDSLFDVFDEKKQKRPREDDEQGSQKKAKASEKIANAVNKASKEEKVQFDRVNLTYPAQKGKRGDEKDKKDSKDKKDKKEKKNKRDRRDKKNKGEKQDKGEESEEGEKGNKQNEHNKTTEDTPTSTNTETALVVSKEAEKKDAVDVDPNETVEPEPEVIRKRCVHDVCLPPTGIDFDPIMHDPPYPVKPAREWPFPLDPFQRMSVCCIERKESVLVSAHTSAGKTVVAEYAIAVALRDKQRVIYTSPIKALSNQKYRELYEIFSDVGLMTGDITINPNASCLVMTTEILRSMLYRGSEVMREVAWVVFDEIHYMRDKSRGVVWEETIILLPDKVRYVFLSATIPNAKEFASWIAKLHQQVCHVVYTDFRPTPLQHYIFPAGGNGLHLVVDEKSTFREDNFMRALSSLTPSDGGGRGGRGGSRGGRGGRGGGRGGRAGGGGGGGGGSGECYKIVKMIMERNYQPVIVFSFAKRECEAYALQMAKLDFNDDDEKSLVESVFNNAIDSLSDDDKKLPQVESVLPLLKRGIGIHHSGLLPILKEVIEILFQEGLIKALFATETFSIGLNMPAKTVVFTNVRKFDGTDNRWLSSGEYIQMSGRAGRRGLDERGIVIMMVDEKMEPAVAKNMIKGQADALNSSFWIGYNMLLNLLRVEEIQPETLLRRSFHQYQHDRTLPDSEKKMSELEKEKLSISIKDEGSVSEYYHLRAQLQKLKQNLRDFTNQAVYTVPFLQPGRLVKVTDGDVKWGWGVVVNFQKKNPKSQSISDVNTSYVVDVLLNCSTVVEPGAKPTACPPGEKGEMQVIPILLPLLDGISSLRIFLPKDLRPVDNRQSVAKSINEVHKRFEKEGIPVLDPVDDMNIDDGDFKKLVRKIETLESNLYSHKLHKDPSAPARFEMYEAKTRIDTEIKEIKKQLKSAGEIILKEDLKGMKRVLRRLGFTNSEDVVEVKGRVACEVTAGDELVITELIFMGLFNEIDAEQTAALLSCFVFDETVKGTLTVREDMQAPLRQLQETARRIAKVTQECKIAIDVEEYVAKFKPSLIDLVYQWCKGAKFSEIMKLTTVFEGSIIRAMRRLEELLRQLAVAAKAIGNTDLEAKFELGITKIKRDIIFAASLYL